MSHVRIQPTKNIEGTKTDAYYLLYFGDKKLAVGVRHDKSTIIIYNSVSLKKEYDLQGNKETTLCIIEAPNSKLLSCGLDSYIMLWNLQNKTCENKIAAHKYIIYELINLSRDRYASCSEDKLIKIWSNSNSLIKTLEGHQQRVFCIVQLKNTEQLVSGSPDSTLRLWDLNNFNCIKIIEKIDVFYSQTIIDIGNNKVVVGSQRGNYHIIDLQSGSNDVKTVGDMGYPTSMLKINDNFIVICSCTKKGCYNDGGKIYLLNYNTFKVDSIGSYSEHRITSTTHLDGNTFAISTLYSKDDDDYSKGIAIKLFKY